MRTLLLLLGCCYSFLLQADTLISLHLNKVLLTSVFATLAQATKLNIIVNQAVQGAVSLDLNQVPFNEALDMILKSQNLIAIPFDHGLYIKLASDHTADLTTPLQTHFFVLHYANAKDILALLNNKANPFLSSRGQAFIDQRTSTLIVSDTSTHLATVTQLLAHLDVPVAEVSISARIVAVDKEALNELGVVLNSSGNSTLSALGQVNQLGINLPISDTPAGVFGIGLGKLAGNSLDLELQALETQGSGKVISAPELTVTDNQTASIEQGSEIPFQTSTSSGATQIEFKKAVLALKVIPHISNNGQILLTLQVEKDTLSSTQAASQLPIISTSSINTEVSVANGDTVILGGIYGEENADEIKKVPVLGGIPGIGWLFRSNQSLKKYTDLIVFITPKIIALKANS